MKSYSTAAHHLLQTVTCLFQHGFLINLERSHLVLKQTIEHLGALINTVNDKGFLSQERRLKIRDLATMVLQTPRPSTQVLAKLLGMIISCYNIILW